jgi:mono/diheme cytochrome c family protein
MKRLAVIAVALLGATLAIRSSSVAHASQLATALRASVWDSVYTDSQTVRGDSLYQAVCIKCHGPTLAGTADGNPLSGNDFVTSWDGLTIDQIYDKIRNEMPPDNPKTIPRELVPDVLAFILKKNGFPAGTKPLPDNPETLKTIKFEKAKRG